MNPGQDESKREGPFSYHDYDGRPNPGSVDFNGKTFLVDKGHKILGWLTPDEGPEVVELMNEAYAQGRLSLESKVKELEAKEVKLDECFQKERQLFHAMMAERDKAESKVKELEERLERLKKQLRDDGKAPGVLLWMSALEPWLLTIGWLIFVPAIGIGAGVALGLAGLIIHWIGGW